MTGGAPEELGHRDTCYEAVRQARKSATSSHGSDAPDSRIPHSYWRAGIHRDVAVVRNANQPCLDQVPGDEHLAENNRKRCEEHHLKKKADSRLKSEAKQAGQDVNNWTYQSSARKPRVTALPKAVWGPLAEVHEELYMAGRPLATAVANGKDLPLSEATVLRNAVDAAIRENQKLLYGEGAAPEDASGPPSEAHTEMGRPGQREATDEAGTGPK